MVSATSDTSVRMNPPGGGSQAAEMAMLIARMGVSAGQFSEELLTGLGNALKEYGLLGGVDVHMAAAKQAGQALIAANIISPASTPIKAGTMVHLADGGPAADKAKGNGIV